MPAETTVISQIPADIKVEALTAALQNHDAYIRITCPQLISYKAESPGSSTAAGVPCVYEVVDKKPIGQTTYKLTLVNQMDGIDALVEGRAPTGTINIRSAWRVVGGKLEEAVVIDSNMLMKKMIKGNVEKSHPEQHQGFFTEARKN